MIPKNLYLIWFGPNEPSNLSYVAQMYKKINIEFNVHVIVERNPDMSSNKDIKTCLELIGRNDNKYAEIFNSIYTTDSSKYNIALSEAFRCFMLDTHGGIYVDCDTFPVMRFTNKLLQNKYFHAAIKTSRTARASAADYFIGAEKNSDIWPAELHSEKRAKPILLTADRKWENVAVRLKFGEKFRASTLKFGQTYEQFQTQYVNHYSMNRRFNVYRNQKKPTPLFGQVNTGIDLSTCIGEPGNIPKNLFLLWFGKELPENFEYVKNTYQLANPDFNIKVYHELDIKHSSNPDIKECREMIMRGNNKYSMIFDAPHFKGNQYTDDVVFNTCFSDTFRCFLIDKYGGIYVDCDTFPAKSFDEKLLSYKKFHCTVKWFIAAYPQLDIFFIGGEPKCDCYPGWVYKADNKIKRPFALPIDDVQQNSLMRKNLRPKYDNQTLRFGDHYGNGKFYVNHFFEKNIRWSKQCNTYQTKYKLDFDDSIGSDKTKILLLTIVKNENNYGQRLQAFALAEFLKKHFNADVKIADQRDSTDGFAGFSSFETQFMPMLRLHSSTDINIYAPDVILLGGDQVLNTSWSSLDQYGYGILSKHSNVMSYASSDGGGGLSQNRQKDIANIGILKKFKSVSVREPSTAEFLKGKGISAETHVDPIYLLTPDEWRKYAVKPSFVDETSEFDFTYLIGKFTGERNGFVTGKDGIQEYICWGNTRQRDAISPSEFLWLIDHCRKFKTSSFHGFSLGIIFGKNDITLTCKIDNPRIATVFDLFGIERSETPTIPSRPEFERLQIQYIGNAYEYFISNSSFTKHPMKNDAACTGCMLCRDVCNTGAISVKTQNGFKYPIIDEAKCINCNKCRKACPRMQSKKNNESLSVFMSTASDGEVFSSGGFVTKLALHYVEDLHGCVYGVEYTNDFKSCVFKREDTIQGIFRQSTSKYVDANPMPFDEIRNDVTSGRPTLFTGLPCQCAAIKAAFGKYSNLMVVSLICNSVPSAEEWKRYVEHIENEKHSKVVSVDMRYNVNDMLIKFENGEMIVQDNLKSDWHTKFLKDNDVIRKSCRACSFKYPNINADFIVGDAWGLNGKKLGQSKANIVFCLTEKAECEFKNICDTLTFEKLDIQQALAKLRQTNPRLFSPR